MSGDQITITEFAPNLFKNIRQKFLSEYVMLECFKPQFNYHALHHFMTGKGKSPSYFFFTDNKLLMLKSLKLEEFKLIFSTNFISKYYKYIISNDNSLLSKILGVYQVKINK